ncbi:MAG: response regulator transcription factor [Chromatiales bacterium]|jgi:two-component system response regulator RegA|nr:response regulator transcription factor [Chromatiales bacterium]
MADRLLVVDDDDAFRGVLAKALARRGFEVAAAANVESAWELALEGPPAYAVVDLCLPDVSGLMLVDRLARQWPGMRIVVLTGYASIATAVEAVKLGATYYLTKPAQTDDIVAAFGRAHGDPSLSTTSQPMSVNRLEWEHIQKILRECGGNISQTAQRLGMHRRTLQRKLQKRPVKS